MQNNTEIPGRGKGAQYLRKQLLSLSFHAPLFMFP